VNAVLSQRACAWMLVLCTVASALGVAIGRPAFANGSALLALAIALLSARREHGAGGFVAPRTFPATAFCLVVLAAAIHWPILWIPFLSDDYWHLVVKGGAPSTWDALLPAKGYPFLRPIPYLPWRLYAALGVDSAVVPHLLNCLLATATAAAGWLAFRRCGAPRSIAFAGALLVLAHPATRHTASYAHNTYPFFSAGFAALCIGLIPARPARAPWHRWIAPSAAAAAAFLSKEDSFLLPVAAALVGAQFRPRRWRDGLRALVPIALVLAVILALRFPLLGGFGGYSQGKSTDSAHAAGAVGAALAALKSQIPSAVVLPIRDSSPWVGVGAVVTASVLLAGFGTRLGRRGLMRGLALAILALAPGLTLWGRGSAHAAAHLLVWPSIGLSLIVASCIAGAGRSRAIRTAALAALIALGAGAGWINAMPWERASEVGDRLLKSAAEQVRDAPQKARLIVYGFPDTVSGVVTFRNSFPWALQHAAARPDLDAVPQHLAFGRFDALLEATYEEGAPLDTIASSWIRALEPTRELRRGERWVAFESQAPSPMKRFDVDDPRMSLRLEPNVPLEFHGGGSTGILAFPAFSSPPGTRLRIEVDGETRWDSGEITPVAICVLLERTDGSFERIPLTGTEGVVPEGVRALRLELAALGTSTLRLRRVSVEAIRE